jgi:hypothetical protein
MYLGNFLQGDTVHFTHRAWLVDPSYALIPVARANPTFTVFNVTGTPTIVGTADKKMAAYDYATNPGLFRGYVLLGSALGTAGSYAIRVRAAVPVAGVPEINSYYFFEIGSGGSPYGAVVGLTEFVRPDVRFLVGYSASDEFRIRKNPRVPQ